MSDDALDAHLNWLDDCAKEQRADYPEMMSFDGPCPFILCLATGPHEHPICPECGAVRYGNIGCDTCRKESGIRFQYYGRVLTQEANRKDILVE